MYMCKSCQNTKMFRRNKNIHVLNKFKTGKNEKIDPCKQKKCKQMGQVLAIDKLNHYQMTITLCI